MNSNYAFSDSGGLFSGLLDDFRITEGSALPPDLADQDADGLSDAQEGVIGTDPLKWDSDGDTISDGFEVVLTGSDPMLATDTFAITYQPELRSLCHPLNLGVQLCIRAMESSHRAMDSSRRPLLHAGKSDHDQPGPIGPRFRRKRGFPPGESGRLKIPMSG